jgi:hypothetical protein
MPARTVLYPAFVLPKTSFRPRLTVYRSHEDPSVLWPKAPGRRAWFQGPEGRVAARRVG